MEKKSWRRNHGGGMMEEESGRHPGGLWETSWSIWEHLGASDAMEASEVKKPWFFDIVFRRSR